MKNFTLSLFGFLLMLGTASAQRTLIHCGNLLDVNTGEMRPQMTIVVEKNKITSVEKGYTKAATGDKTVDLKNSFVLPGLIDMHVHLEGETRRGGAYDRYTQNPPDVAFLATKHARTTLLAGFTTVRDLGGSGVNVSLRNAVNRGIVVGPRIFTAGKSIATTGGHADPTNGYRRDLMGDPGPMEGVVNGVDDARKAVRQRYKDGADVIKITATGGGTVQRQGRTGTPVYGRGSKGDCRNGQRLRIQGSRPRARSRRHETSHSGGRAND